MGYISRFYIWIKRKQFFTFIAITSFAMVVSELIVSYILIDFMKLPSRSINVSANHAVLVVAAIIIAPIIETAVAQLFPYKVLSSIGVQNKYAHFIFMLIVFSMLHISAGAASVIVAGVIGGAYISLAFLRFSDNSIKLAYLASLLCHLINNFAVVSFFVFSRL